MDANFYPKVDPQKFIEMTKPKDVGTFEHTKRNCIYQEAKTCKRLNKDDSRIIDEQMDFYKKNNYPENNGLAATFLLVRKHTPEVKRMNEKWWAHLSRFSKRDQLSFPVVFDDVKYFTVDNMINNEYFKRIGHKS